MELLVILALLAWAGWYFSKGQHLRKARLEHKSLAGASPKAKSKKPRSYTVAIVGESHYQPAIRQCREGDYVDFFKEPGNPYSESGQALAVADLDGRTLGYVPDESWLKRVVFKEGKGIVGKIKIISKGEGRTFGVWLTVAIDGPPLGERDFTRL